MKFRVKQFEYKNSGTSNQKRQSLFATTVSRGIRRKKNKQKLRLKIKNEDFFNYSLHVDDH